MNADDLKAALQRARRQPMQFAVVLGKQPNEHRLSLHPTRAGRSLAKTLREDTGLKLATWGSTEVDDSRRDTLVLVLEDRALPGLGKKLQAWLKLMGAPIRKVAIKVDGQELEDEDPGQTDPGANDPTQDSAQDWARLMQAFEQLKPRIQSIQDQGNAKATLLKLQDAFQLACDKQALPQARQAIKLLIQQVQAFTQAPTAEPTLSAQELRQAVQALPEGLGDAILKTHALQQDPQLQKARQQLKQQGDQVRSLILQMRAARRSQDADQVAELQAQIERSRQQAREQLKTLVPIKGQVPPEQGKEAWVALVARLDLASPKDGAVFWSGDKNNAIDVGQEREGISLESTAGGCLMDDWALEGIPWSEREGEGPPFLKDLWQLMSATYAMQAEGEITVVQTPAKHREGGGEMWRLVERKILLAKIKQRRVTMGKTIVRDAQP